MQSEHCLCEKCEYFTFQEKFDTKLSLCELCKEEENDNDTTKDKETAEASQAYGTP